MMDDNVVGVIGLGNMGAAIADRLMDTDTRLVVYDPSPEAIEWASGRGAIVVASARAVADRAPLVMACLPSLAVSRAVAAEVASGAAIRTYVETSTIGPDTAREIAASLREHAIGFVDAAISGGAPAARKGELAVMIAGDHTDVAAAQPALAKLAARVFAIGPTPGQAQTMKLVNNILAAANMASAFEALVLGTQLGLDPAMMIDVLNAGSARSMALVERRASAILKGSFDSGPKLGLLNKDIELALRAADAAGFPLDAVPTLSGAAALWSRAAQAGLDGADVSALIRVVEDAAGITVRDKAADHRHAD